MSDGSHKELFMRQPPAILFAILLGSSACVLDGASSSQGASEGGDEGGGGDFDRDDCKVEDGDIGVQGVSLDLGSKKVTFESWIPKDDSPGEFVGFTLSLAGGDTISYLVKSGGARHAAQGLSWAHPNGTSGSDVPGISHVDFCDEVDGGGDGDGDCEPNVDTGSCDPGGGGGGGGGDDDGDGGVVVD
jgi:hypothetical protein